MPKVDLASKMPKNFDLPPELFEINMPKSSNPTINFCDAIVRKANILNDKFRSHRKPAYMNHSYSPKNAESTESLPYINRNILSTSAFSIQGNQYNNRNMGHRAVKTETVY